jgi:hypothetical protein
MRLDRLVPVVLIAAATTPLFCGTDASAQTPRVITTAPLTASGTFNPAPVTRPDGASNPSGNVAPALTPPASVPRTILTLGFTASGNFNPAPANTPAAVPAGKNGADL